MPRDLHGRGLTYACVDQVSDSRSTEIVRYESLIFVPLGTRLNAEFEFNTCLDPFAPEVFRVEDSLVCLALLPKHRNQFLRQRQNQCFAVLYELLRYSVVTFVVLIPNNSVWNREFAKPLRALKRVPRV